jgi:hypothetical protein
MKKTEQFQYTLLMNQHIHVLVNTLLSKLAFVLSLREALFPKDNLEEDERFSDETFETQDRFYQAYLPFLRKVASQSQPLRDVIAHSEIIPLSLSEGLLYCLELNEEDNLDETNPFNPFSITKKSFQDSIEEFQLRVAYIYRVYHWLVDIEVGMQEYGVESYLVPVTDSESDVTPLDGIYDLSKEEIEKEVIRDLKPNDSDTDEMQQEKQALKDLLSKINEKGEKHK